MPPPTDPPPADAPSPDDWRPLEPHEHEAQLATILKMTREGSRVLDLGAGDGRLALPLAAQGMHVCAVERDHRAIDALRASNAQIEVIPADFLEAGAIGALKPRSIDLAMCLGHTFLQIVRPLDAMRLLERLGLLLSDRGALVIDAFCDSIWREVASGNWQEGLSDDGSMQLVWGEGDNIIALRRGRAIDEDAWSVRESDEPLRLWSRGELELLARAAGWQAPRTIPEAHLIVLTPRRES